MTERAKYEKAVNRPVPILLALVWALALLTFVVGDVATTHLGLQMGAIETHPVAQGLLSGHGMVALVGLKAAVLAVGGFVYVLLPKRLGVGVPAGLAFLGVTVTGWNVVVISVLV